MSSIFGALLISAPTELWPRISEFISPVQKVAKLSTRPPFMLTHLQCVPGITTTPSATPEPTSCVSSPRITSGSSLLMPGMMASGPSEVATVTILAASTLASAVPAASFNPT